ncbi:MAG: RNA polymerase subunit sigma-24 [Bacteroidetes bacterium]|nr:MAG: RNA polymerase subunit sigma-24 [Bacteroidota bacterium]PTM14090.1 MAG: RNA polymerase subunit sigma-24 [Bacteroidota bacterium]
MTESEIIRGCQRGKAKYQKELVLRYSPQLMTVARRYCRDDHAARDVLQEAFIKVFRAIDRYEPTGAFPAWLRRIVINAALQTKDKASYQREQTNLDAVAHPLVAPNVLSQMGAEELIALIQQLPDGFRDVFNLYVLEGYSHDEIADMLGIAPGTSRSQLVRARQKLQAMILQREKECYVKRVG